MWLFHLKLWKNSVCGKAKWPGELPVPTQGSWEPAPTQAGAGKQPRGGWKAAAAAKGCWQRQPRAPGWSSTPTRWQGIMVKLRKLLCTAACRNDTREAGQEICPFLVGKVQAAKWHKSWIQGGKLFGVQRVMVSLLQGEREEWAGRGN